MNAAAETIEQLALPADVLAVLADPQQAAALLESIGREHGDERYSRAAGHLRGQRGGRPACDDADALRQIRDLLGADDALSIHSAASFVSRSMSGNHSAEATAWRLARKFRAAMKKQTALN